jgi:hypothetical protein
VSVENQAGDGEQQTSLRDELAAAMTAIETRESTGEEIGDKSQISGAEGGESSAKEIGQDGSRDDGRDATGRFAAKPKTQGAEAVGDSASAAAAGADTANAAAPGEAAAGDEAPPSWRGPGKAAWANIPAEARTEILRREREAADMAGRMDGERRFGKEFAEIVRPHMETINKFGITPQFAVQTLMANDRTMRTGTIQEKVSLAYRMLADYGLDPAAFAQPQPGVSQDPHVRRLEAELAQMRASTATPQQQAVAPLPQGEPDAMTAQIEAFRSDPAHPHFDQVLPTMTALLESGAAPDLAAAYEQAVWSNPTLRSTLPQAQAAQADAQRQSTATKTAAARRADVSVSGSPGAAGSHKPASLRDELKQQLQAQGFI